MLQAAVESSPGDRPFKHAHFRTADDQLARRRPLLKLHIHANRDASTTNNFVTSVQTVLQEPIARSRRNRDAVYRRIDLQPNRQGKLLAIEGVHSRRHADELRRVALVRVGRRIAGGYAVVDALAPGVGAHVARGKVLEADQRRAAHSIRNIKCSSGHTESCWGVINRRLQVLHNQPVPSARERRPPRSWMYLLMHLGI